jgi:hypothetical protein
MCIQLGQYHKPNSQYTTQSLFPTFSPSLPSSWWGEIKIKLKLFQGAQLITERFVDFIIMIAGTRKRVVTKSVRLTICCGGPTTPLRQKISLCYPPQLSLWWRPAILLLHSPGLKKSSETKSYVNNPYRDKTLSISLIYCIIKAGKDEKMAKMTKRTANVVVAVAAAF